MGEERKAWERVHTYIALVTLVITMGAIVWKAGGTDAGTESRIIHLENDMRRVEAEYARKDVIEERLKNIQESMAKIERSQDAETRILEDFSMSMRKARSKE